MTEALPVTDISLAEIEAAGPRRRRLRRPAAAGRRASRSARSTPTGAATATADRPTGRDRRDLRARPRTSRTATTALWATERASARDPGWHRTGDVGHLDDDGRLWVEGRLVHVVTTADGPGHPGRGRAAGRGASTGSRRPPCVGVGPAGTQQVVVVVVPSAGGAAGAGRSPPPTLAGAVRAAAAGAGGRGRAGRPRAAGRHPARLEGRPRRGRPLGRPGAGRRPGRAPVRVLVTGASGMLGRGVAPRPCSSAATTSPCCSAGRPGCALPRGARRRRRPGRGRAGPSRGRTPSCTWPPRST